MKLTKLCTFFMLTLMSGMVFSTENQQVSKADLKLLPPYCKGTQLIRDVSGDRTPIEDYIKLYGPAFMHLHHYCWALNTENKYYRRALQKHWLQYSIGDLDYVLGNSPPDFIFIPEIHLAKARFYSILKKHGMAIASAHQALQVKPDFAQAYVFISDLHENMGNKASAIKTLEAGYKQVPDSKPILRRMTRLGVKPPQLDVNPSKKTEGAASPTSIVTEANTQKNELEPGPQDSPIIAPTPPQPTPQAQPDAAGESPNPYCRFCP